MGPQEAGGGMVKVEMAAIRCKASLWHADPETMMCHRLSTETSPMAMLERWLVKEEAMPTARTIL